MKVYAMVLPQSAGRRLGKIFSNVGTFLAEFVPEIKSDLIMATIKMSAEEYVVASLASCLIIGVLMFTCTYLPLIALEVAPGSELVLAFIPALILALMDFIILLRYPRILALKRAELVEKDLIYALKDLLLNISAGLSLFEGIKKVSEGDHGIVSQDLETVVKNTNRGMPLDDALEMLALHTSSDYMRNALWQIVNAVKAGTSVKDAVSGIIDALIRDQKRKIRNYIQELNVLTMIYMLFAVAVPTIITTVLVVLTSLTGTGVDENTYIIVISVCIIIQIMLVGFIRSRRPLIYVS